VKSPLITGCALAALGVLGRPAFAEDDPTKTETLLISLDYALGTYVDTVHRDGTTDMDVTGTVTQARYAIGIRLELYDWRNKTPLGTVPGIWFDGQLGYVAADSFSGDRSGTAGEGGPLLDLRMSGPWKLLDTPHLRLGAGLGFRGGIEVGAPPGTGRLSDAFAFDASVMAIADLKLSKATAMIEGEYAAGVGYTEQRLYGNVGLGWLALGATLTAGQADVNYVVFGLNLGYRRDNRR